MKKILFCLLVMACQTILAQDTLLVPTQDVLTQFKCYSPLKTHEAVLITNQAEARTKLKSCVVKSYQDALAINFTQNDIIFCNFNTGLVNEISCDLYKIPSQKKYVLLINQKYKKAIADINQAHRIIYLTPKLDAGYTLELKEIETDMLKSQSPTDKK